MMTAYKDRSRDELLQEKASLEAQFDEVKARGLKLDMSRGNHRRHSLIWLWE